MDKGTSYVRKPVDAEARGQLRVYLKKLEVDHAAFMKACEVVVRPTFRDFLRKKEKGRARVFKRINEAITRHGARLMHKRLTGNRPVALWAVLEPRTTLWVKPEHPRDEQDCVCLNFFYIGWIGDRGVATEGLWTVEVTKHALGRYLQRSADRDPTEAIFAAHEALLKLPDSVLEKLQFKLRVGDHAWQCEPNFGRDPHEEINVHITLRTYLEFDQLSPQQEAELVSSNMRTSGAPMAETWLLPIPLKRIVEVEDGFFEVRRRKATDTQPFAWRDK